MHSPWPRSAPTRPSESTVRRARHSARAGLRGFLLVVHHSRSAAPSSPRPSAFYHCEAIFVFLKFSFRVSHVVNERIEGGLDISDPLLKDAKSAAHQPLKTSGMLGGAQI